MKELKDALSTIYDCLGGPGWTRQKHWRSDQDPSEWQGVTCCPTSTGGITVLELSQNNLKGKLDDPRLLAALLVLAPTLEQLWLSENGLQGTLPSILACPKTFPRLTILDVGQNQLRGSLHPAFAKRTFSWLETSGNQLTSYYRYTTTTTDSNINSNINHELDLENSDVLTNATKIPTLGGHVHVLPSVFSKPQCAALILAAERIATKCNGNKDKQEGQGGWIVNHRHKAYPTTDLDIALCDNNNNNNGDGKDGDNSLLDLCNAHLKAIILPVISSLFEFAMEDLAVEDLFLARYSAAKGQQSALPQHRDDSELSFVLTLNDAFQGGGTRFAGSAGTALDDSLVIAPATGGAVFFCGRQWHSGIEVTAGTRYILAGFVRVYPSTPDAVAKLDRLLLQATISTNK